MGAPNPLLQMVRAVTYVHLVTIALQEVSKRLHVLLAHSIQQKVLLACRTVCHVQLVITADHLGSHLSQTNVKQDIFVLHLTLASIRIQMDMRGVKLNLHL